MCPGFDGVVVPAAMGVIDRWPVWSCPGGCNEMEHGDWDVELDAEGDML